MKFGLLINRGCLNLGDDIQSYAESLFLPRIDYLVDREYINSFKTEDPSESVATIMGAWWTRHKWNMLPPRNIIPLWTSIHLSNYSPMATGTMPPFPDMLHGVLADNMRAYGPVGTRDMATLDLLRENEIPAFFSGCVTLTLPKMDVPAPKNPYVLIVDVDPRVEKIVRSKLDGSGIDVKTLSNNRSKRRTQEEMDDWEFRKKETLDLLETYQAATCVVTRRLHVSLPCLAMDVPVLCVHDPKNSRFSPYNEWLHMVSVKDFLAGSYKYDFANPPDNKDDFEACRDEIAAQLRGFVTDAENGALEQRVTYTDKEVMEWENEVMRLALNKWQPASIKMAKKIKSLKHSERVIKKDLKKIKKSTSWKIISKIEKIRKRFS